MCSRMYCGCERNCKTMERAAEVKLREDTCVQCVSECVCSSHIYKRENKALEQKVKTFLSGSYFFKQLF